VHFLLVFKALNNQNQIGMGKIYRPSVLFAWLLSFFAFAMPSLAQCPVNPAFTFQKSCSQDFRIAFTNGTTVTPPGQVDYYRWHFGDATTSTATNPSHTYPAAGTYQVILFVYDTSGCYDSIVQNVLATALPQASFTYTQSGCSEISFTNTSTYAGISPAWFWTFGDGQISTQEHPVHTYATGGIKNVSLTLTDQYGCSNTYLFAINVFPAATVDFTYDQSNCELVNFFDNSTGTGAITRLWDFGDGATSTATNPSHTFTLGNTYVVTLTISDQYCNGLVHTDTLVFPNPPTADFTFSPDGQCATTPIDFDATGSTGTNLNYSWNFGDGNTATGLFLPWTQHTYNSYNNAACDLSQSYNVALTVTDGIGCTDTDSDLVTTQRVPQPLLQDLSGNNFQNCYSVNPADPTDTLWIDNITPNMNCITHLDISWGDGTDTLGLTSGDFPLMHVYLTMGEFPLTVTAYGVNGCISDTTYVVANQVNPSVGISGVGANSGCAPYTAKFVLHGYTGNSVGTSYIWDFDDGTIVVWNYNQPYINDTIEHVYTQSHCANPEASSQDGYIPSVTAVNACGTWASTIQYITIFESPVASFTSIDTTNYGCFDEPFCFLNYTYHGFSTSCDSSVNYTWDFGDGNGSTLAEPCHTYAYPGTYQVNLWADNPLCGGSDTTIAIHITGVHADFTFDTACVNNETHFTNLSWAYDDSTFQNNPAITLTGFYWDFGDGSTSTLQNPTHVFPDTGTYTVSLTVTSEYGCDSTITRDVFVDGLFIDYVDVDSITCHNANNGSITVYTAGGIPTITFNLNPGNITNTNGFFGGLGPGAYWVFAEDAKGCWAETDTIYLTEPDPISIDSVFYTDITCHNDDDGTITAYASGGTNPLTFTLIPIGISNGTGLFTGLSGGTYQVVVEDVNNCPADTSAPITIINPLPVIIDSIQYDDISCHNAGDGWIQAWASGGTGTLTYTLNPPGTANTSGLFENLNEGTYTVTVTDENNCGITSGDIEIENPPAIVISTVDYTDMSCHDTLDGSITVTASGGTATLTYTLLPTVIINSTGVFTGLGAGNYYVRVEDINGCADSTATITIMNPDEILITLVEFTDITCHNDNDGSIEVTATGGTAPLSYTLIPPGITNASGEFTGLVAGTYQVVVEDINACPADTTAPITITNPPLLIIDSVQHGDISCHNANDGWIQAWASGGTGTLTYTLNPPGTSNASGLFENLGEGTYTVSVTDENNCEITSGDIEIDNPPAIVISTVDYTDMSCHDTLDGSITVTAFGGMGTLTYTLLPVVTINSTGIFTGLGAGSYYVRIVDANGCADSTATITITNPDEVLIGSVSWSDITCHDDNDGSIEVSASGGTAPLTYTLIPPGITNGTGLFTGLAAGTYRVVAEDINACPSDTTAPITIINPPELLIDSMQYMDISCFNANDGWIQLWASGGVPALTYTLNPGGISNPLGLFTNLSAGIYTVTVSDMNGCAITSGNIEIINPLSVQITSFAHTNMSCHDTLDGSITVTASGGTGIPQFTLLPPGTTNITGVFTGLGQGTYYVKVTDANGCSDSTSNIVILNPGEILITNENLTPISCHNANDGIIEVIAGGGTLPYTYTLYPPVIQNGNGLFTGLQPGSYYVIVEDANGCPSDTSSVFSLNNPDELVVDSIQSMDISCQNYNDGWIQVWASGGTGTLSYTLNPSGIVNSTGLFTNLAGGIYTVSVSDANGCNLLTGNIEIINPSSVQITGFTYTDMSCHDTLDGSITVTAAGGTGSPLYTLMPGGTSNFTGIFSGLGAGSYYVRVEDANGCADSTASIIIINPDEILILTESVTQIDCYNANNGIAEVTAGGGNPPYSFTLLPVGITNGTGQFTGLAAGTYYIVAGDANACPADTSNPLLIINPPELLIDSTDYSHISCNGYANGWIQIWASGGSGTLTYTLNPGGISNASGYFNSLSPGTYTITIRDTNNCTTVSPGIPIIDPPPINSNVSFTNVSCFGFDDGSITITASGGVGMLEYSIDNGFTYFPFSTFTNLTPGTYIARVRDANGCETMGVAVVITQPALLQITGFSTITPTCFGCSDGEITANVSGGTMPYTHSWSNGMSGNPITGIPSGWYTDTVTDANGCQVIDSVFLNEPGPLSVILDSSNVVCYGEFSGWVAAIATGGTAPYTYEWTKLPSPVVLGTADTLFNCDAGFYAVTVFDFFNNIVRDTIEVGQPDTLALTLAFSDTVCYGADNGWASVLTTGGIPPYTYLWSGGTGATTDSIYNLTAGIYTITVTDQHGCQTIDAVTINENPELFVTATTSDPLICSGISVQLNAAASGGTLPVATYQWTPAAGLSDPLAQSPEATPAFTTTYAVVITDQRGCTATDSVTVNVEPSPTAAFIYQNPCASNIVNFLNMSNANGGTIVSYFWDFGDGYFSNIQHPTHNYATVDTTYTVSLVVQNSNGCTDTIVQGVYVNPMLGLVVSADTVCIGNPTTFSDTVTNPNAVILSYFYDFGDGFTDTVSNPVHQYAMPGLYLVNVSIEDTSGCVEATSLQVRVHALPFPDFSDSTSCITDTTYFTDLTDTTAAGIISWYWDFGDGNSSALQHPEHHYTLPGTYMVSLNVENVNGCTNSVTKAVIVYPRPEAAFLTDSVCLGAPTYFTDISTSHAGVINAWFWDFGDGNTSTLQNPVHFYSAAGYYNVMLVIGSTSGCTDTAMQVAGVYELPQANFSHDTPCEFNPVSFTDLSLPNSDSLVAWYWDFGDGYSSNQQHPQHIFPGGGTYSVNLTVTNSNGCTDDTTMLLTVNYAPTVNFSYSVSPCTNDTTYFTDLSTANSGFIIGWEWDFGDGNSSLLQHPAHVYTAPGLYPVSLVVTNSEGCSDTMVQNLIIHPQPVADFSFGSSCVNLPTFFYDESSTTSGQIISWEWDFGDPGSGAANFSGLQNPSHTYIFAGIYDVRLIVTNTTFCSDTIIRQVAVRPSPTANFSFNMVCHGDSTLFLDASLPASAPFEHWHWDFGDGNSLEYTSFTDSVYHVYNNQGQYHVTLTVTDTAGCSNSITRMVMIFGKPTALFAYNQSCVNNLTHFTDYSNGSGADIVAWYWDFGDPASGALNNSTLQNPTHQYSVAGDYFVTLWVVNAEGCENQTTQTITVTPGPVADFEAENSCVGFITFFNNLSYAIGENIISWQWDFGDGTSSILQFPTHVYASGGTYWVSLTVETENGCFDNIVKPITIYDLPVPGFTYSTPNCFGDSTYFTDLSTFIGGNVITAWHWDFGDGSIDTINQHPVHHYAFPGYYNVTLTVYDTNGCYNSVIEEVYVNGGPIAGFHHYTSTCDTVFFTDQSIGSGAGLLSWFWDFGDPASGWNNFSTLEDPYHVYVNSGTYQVMLVVTDSLGCTDTTWQSLDIYKPVADFDYSGNCVNTATHFTDLSYVTGDVIVSWLWDFGDGTTSIASDPIHIYTAPGIYYVTLTVTSSSGCSTTAIREVDILIPPMADFEFTSACFGEDIQFTDLSYAHGLGPIVAWDWAFGDGNTSTVQNPVHNYSNPGSYTVSLVVYDANGCFATTSKNLGVFESPDAAFTANDVCFGMPVQFIDESVTNGLPIVSWHWDFGDGNYSTNQHPFHFYPGPGNYTVTLTITDLGGCEDVMVDDVNVFDTPLAMFTADSVCVGHQTSFTDLSLPLGDIVSWQWDFGDPASGFYNLSFLQNPTHTYNLEGTYVVTLTVTDIGGCSNTVSQAITVEPPPFANFTFTNEHCVDEPVLFIDLSQTVNEIITTWIWDFGDGTRDTIYHPANPNIEHTFANPGMHLVTLTVVNVNGCVGSTSKPINILPEPIADFNHSSACENTVVQFTDMTNQNGGGQIINWWWDFGDPLSGSTNNSQLQNPQHQFTGTGVYNVTLIAWNSNSCRDTIVRSVYVSPSPSVDYYYDNACEGELTQFYVNDTVVNINTTVSYLWDFGDGTFSNLQNPAHAYASFGTFMVTLTITDTSLCQNSITKEVIVDKLPLAFFDISEPTCSGDSVFFNDLSSTTYGYIQTWVWDFDDGTPPLTIVFPDDPNVYHTYTDPGTYGATLTVTNSQGCSHSFMRAVNILATPIANFHWSANPCQNEEVQFSDASFPNGQGNILSWYWEFDDPMSGINNTSTQQNPVHIFSEGGVYDVLLIIVNFNDCTDTIIKQVSVNESPDVAFLWEGACEDTLTYFYPDSLAMNPSSVIAWHWDFGDGQYSTQPNPAHHYENSGYYDVTLTIQDTGICTNSRTETIFINAKPNAFFDVSEVSCAGSPVYFDDLSSVANSYIVSWHWDFGDGTDTTIFFPNNPDVEHIYAMPGTYPVTLGVISADSCYADASQYVIIDAAPIALFNYEQACFGTPTQFWDNSGNGGGMTIISWNWNFGDPQSGVNNTSGLQNPMHLYTAPGTYDVTLSVTNAGGCVDSILQQVVVSEGAAVDFYVIDSCLNIGTRFFVDPVLSDTAAIVMYEWNFGDGSPLSHQMNPVHMYNYAGLYEVTLTILDTSGCSNAVSHYAEVRDNPIALFSYEAACAADSVYFSDLSYTINGDMIVAWSWNFGDPASGANNYSSLQHPTHIFSGMQNYYVSLVVTTDHGCQDSLVIPVAVKANPVSDYNYVADPCTPGLVYFTDNSSSVQSVITQWEWYMEPGTYSYVPNPHHVFLVTDTTYQVRLTVTDANGCTDEIIQEVYIPTGFEVELNYSQTCDQQAMLFSATVVQPVNVNIFSYHWDFGEPASGPNNTSNLPEPQHTYLNPGYYTVSLTAMDENGCQTIVYRQVVVNELPEAAFDWATNLCDSTIYFTDVSLGNGADIISWRWDFGDGTPPQYIETPPGNTAHFYEFEGIYEVKLTVTNANGCADDYTGEVNREPCLSADFQVLNSPVCERNNIIFADNSGIDFLIHQWHWDFGDGTDTTYQQKSGTVSHYYSAAGQYNVSLVISAMFNNVLLADTFVQQVVVRPTPLPAFSCEPVCFGNTSTFIDITQDMGANLSSWHWNFGTGLDCDTSALRNPVFKYDSTGAFDVCLIAVNQYGCFDSVVQPVMVNQLPMGHFEYTTACENQRVYFTDLSDGIDCEISSWQWHFNDPVLSSDMSDQQHPWWAYAEQGTNAVKLIVSNANGCSDTVIYDVTVYGVPTAAFDLTANYDNMQGSVLLEDQSEGAIEYLWDFGDGYEVWDNYPPVSHIYEQDGDYLVRLVVWNEHGCTDTSMMNFEFMFKTLYIPNALAPSSMDPEVKVFKPKGRNLREFYIAIHDSWGNLLWESNRLDQEGRPVDSWDGTYNGKLLPTDVYIWRARAVFRDGTFWEGNVIGNNEGGSGTTHGNVTLVR
jgi:PKD repeat protein